MRRHCFHPPPKKFGRTFILKLFMIDSNTKHLTESCNWNKSVNQGVFNIETRLCCKRFSLKGNHLVSGIPVPSNAGIPPDIFQQGKTLRKCLQRPICTIGGHVETKAGSSAETIHFFDCSPYKLQLSIESYSACKSFINDAEGMSTAGFPRT